MKTELERKRITITGDEERRQQIKKKRCRERASRQAKNREEETQKYKVMKRSRILEKLERCLNCKKSETEAK